MKKDVLGIKIDDVSLDEALKIVSSWLSKPGKHYIVTPNPEFLMAARKDPEFKRVLNKADLSVPDGVGLKWFGGIHNRVPGVDLMEELIKLSSDKGCTVSFLGGKQVVADKMVECLLKKYPNLKVGSVSGGILVNIDGVTNLTPTITPADLLFVAFGHIKQEKWMADNLDKIPIKVAMGVGGSFNYLSGVVPRAPTWVRSLGFEWLFRLAVQPWRIKRQLVLLKFLWLVLH